MDNKIFGFGVTIKGIFLSVHIYGVYANIKANECEPLTEKPL